MARNDARASRKKSANRPSPAEQSRMADVRQAFKDLRALRQEIASRPGFTPLSDKEILDAIRTVRADRWKLRDRASDLRLVRSFPAIIRVPMKARVYVLLKSTVL